MPDMADKLQAMCARLGIEPADTPVRTLVNIVDAMTSKMDQKEPPKPDPKPDQPEEPEPEPEPAAVVDMPAKRRVARRKYAR